LPKLDVVDSKPGFNKRNEEAEKLVYSPNLEEGKDSVYDFVFEKEIGGMSEYGYGLWSRWL
jgi:hypothetical protein